MYELSLLDLLDEPWAVGSQVLQATAASGELAIRIRGPWPPE